jgi:hypothetical protein
MVSVTSLCMFTQEIKGDTSTYQAVCFCMQYEYLKAQHQC